MSVTHNKIDFANICRICLKSYKKLCLLFETEAPNMLNFCGFLEVMEGDGYPNKICEICNNMLLQSYELKKLCLSSKSLLSILKSQNSNKYDQDTANLNLDYKHLKSQEVTDSEPTRTNKISSPYNCSECHFSFSCKELFNEHCCRTLIDDHHHYTLPSNECVDPLLQSENDPESVCKTGNEVNICSKEILYHCQYCNFQFSHKEDALAHQSIHSIDDLCCNVCKKSCKTMKVLKRHIKIHMIVKSHICKICNKGFSESTALSKHTKRHHLHVPREKNYNCSECGQRFTDQYYLNLHKRKHSGEKPYKCEVCNKCFYDPRSYNVHMNVHNGTKPYLCSHCGKSFVQSAHLKVHLIVHTKEKPYTCNVCNKSFTQLTSLHRHQKVVCAKRV